MSQAFQDRQRERVQELLQQRATEEGLDPEEVRVEAPREPQVDPKVWRDVEPLLFRGFLVLPAKINDISFVFKSLNHHEFEMLQWVHGGRLEDYYNLFLAYGVFMIDGQNLLPEREKYAREIAQSFGEYETAARNKLIRYVSEVNRRAVNAIRLVEAYAMEPLSRIRWTQHKGLDLCAPSVTGIPGTERLGLNWGQLIWRSLNTVEDTKELAESEWENAKFTGSCMAGKGISKVYHQDTQRRKSEREEKIKHRDKLLRQVILLEPEGVPGTEGIHVKHSAETVEELASQLERDLKGEADWHDQIVRAEEERIRQMHLDRQRQLEQMAAEREQEFKGRAVVAFTDKTGLSQEEVQQRLQRRRQIEAQQLAASMSRPSRPDDFFYDGGGEKRQGRYADTWLDAPDEGPGDSVSLSDKDPTGALPLPPPRPRGTPFGR